MVPNRADAADVQVVINAVFRRGNPVLCDVSGDGLVNATAVQVVIDAVRNKG